MTPRTSTPETSTPETATAETATAETATAETATAETATAETATAETATAGMPGALGKLRVLELGQRTGARLCGSLFAQLGAEVIAVEIAPRRIPKIDATPSTRALLLAGKRSFCPGADDADDGDALSALAAFCNVIIISSDDDGEYHPVLEEASAGGSIVIDITTVTQGAAHPLAGRSDAAVQAFSGMMETTGLPAGPPTLVDGNPVEVTAALHGFAGALAALYAKEKDGRGQRVSVSLLDCAISSHAVFMSKLTELPDAPARRTGNRHLLASPWNIFRAADGWLLICMASEIQWQRFCALTGNAALAAAPGFDSGPARRQNLDAMEAHVQAWTKTLTLDEVSNILLEANIPCGAVVPVDGYPREANLNHRQMIATLNGADGKHWYGAGRLVHASATPGAILTDVPAPDEARDWVFEQIEKTRLRPPKLRGEASTAAPLAGIRVVELGHYTAAPLTGRYLANLGAEVIKVEAPGGEAMRGWAPQRHGVGTFYVVNNTGKRNVVLDLKQPDDLAKLESLVNNADIVVENLKPGALARMGLSFKRLQALNPGIIYCAVCGFGADSKYPGRPAYDTVIQAMAGVMDRTRSEGLPVKTGMSLADVLGANLSVGLILAALLHREGSGKGQFIDVSMQDVAAWAMQLTWNNAPTVYEKTRIATCSDGQVLIEDTQVPPALEAFAGGASRAELAARWPELVTPIQTLNEFISSPHADGQVAEITDRKGRSWPVLINPIRLSRTPLLNRAMLSGLGDDNFHYFAE